MSLNIASERHFTRRDIKVTHSIEMSRSSRTDRTKKRVPNENHDVKKTRKGRDVLITVVPSS